MMATIKKFFKPVSLRLLLALLLFCVCSQANLNTSDNMVELSDAQREDFSKKLAVFAINVYTKLSLSKPSENIVFSPFSIQTCAAMARIGAEGETAAELDRGLGLISSDLGTVAESFNSVLAQYEKSNILKIANRIYVMKGYTVKKSFNDILKQKFFSDAEEIDFEQNQAAAETINGWVESKTNNLIKKLIAPDALDQYTRLVLLNAIHFKGEWKTQFNKDNTHDEDFYLNESDSVKVPMMNLKSRFRYADLSDLDATALEMPYKDSDLSMLIILPNSRTGLKSLEQKLATVPLSDISSKLYSTEVIVKLPKFKAEFTVELSDTFKQLGMPRMFSDDAEFGQMLNSKEELKVSQVIHKAFIDVNEEGTEAAAATAITAVAYCSFISPRIELPKEFLADRPFFYIIRNRNEIVLFNGKLVNK